MRNYKRGDVVKRQRERKSNVFMRLYLFDYPSVTYGDSSPDKGSQNVLFRQAETIYIIVNKIGIMSIFFCENFFTKIRVNFAYFRY